MTRGRIRPASVAIGRHVDMLINMSPDGYTSRAIQPVLHFIESLQRAASIGVSRWYHWTYTFHETKISSFDVP